MLFCRRPDRIDGDLYSALEWAGKEIHIRAARRGDPLTKSSGPVVVLRTPKGQGCQKKLQNEFIEGSFRAHQAPLPAAKSDPRELEALQSGLESYQLGKIFELDGTLSLSVLQLIPPSLNRRVGTNPYTNHERLLCCNWKHFSPNKGDTVGSLSVVGEYLDRMLQGNPDRLRRFNPNELVSNRLYALFRYIGRKF